MKPIAIFYGTSSGNTEEAAGIIAKLLEEAGHSIELIEVEKRMDPARLLEFDQLIIGCPTWDIGELQSDWDRIHSKLGDLEFGESSTIALFGCGDAQGYPDTFQDAIGILGKEFRSRGAKLIGTWPTDGYDFSQSEALEDGKFMGLALDYDNNPADCDEQIQTWVKQIVEEFAAA